MSAPARSHEKRDNAPDAPRDTRRPACAETIAEALAAAAKTLEPFRKERLWLEPPESFARMRAFFACLPDDERRRVLFHFLADEGRRIDHDEAARFRGTP